MRALLTRLIPRTPSRAVSGFAAAISFAVGGVALVRWLDPFGEAAPLAERLWAVPFAALGLLFGGGALGALRDERPGGFRKRFGALGAAGAGLIGVLLLLTHVAPAGADFTHRPSFHAGLVLALLGPALLLLDARPARGPQPAQLLALVAFLVAAVALLGHASGAPILYTMSDAGLSGPAAALGAALALGVLCARPDAGFVALLRDAGSAGLVARALVLAPLLIPLGMGLLVLVGHRTGVFGPTAGGWLFQMAYYGGFTLIIWWVAGVIRRAELERTRHQAHFRAVTETAAQAIVSGDRTGRVTYLNPAGERMFGYSAAEMVGRPLGSLLSERFRAEHQKELNRVLAAPEGRAAGRAAEMVGVRRDGTEFPIELSLAGWRAGGEACFSVILSDIGDRKRAEEEVRRLNADLEDRVRARTAELEAVNRDLAQKSAENEMFVYSVSHDLRSPLVNLQGFSRELEKGGPQLAALFADEGVPPGVRDRGRALLDGKVTKSIGFIQSAVLRLSGIIDAMLRLSRAGRIEYRREAVDVGRVVAQVVGAAHGSITERGAVVRVGELPGAWGDRTAIEQVFGNLIGNALTYLDPARPGVIEVGCRPAEGGFRTYFVRDNGLGIAEGHRQKIFQAFQRAHPGIGSGEGLGLAIVSRVAERHRGRVWVETRPGEGSTFFVTLPAAPEAGGREPITLRPEREGTDGRP